MSYRVTRVRIVRILELCAVVVSSPEAMAMTLFFGYPRCACLAPSPWRPA
jgi:hypothetical protein